MFINIVFSLGVVAFSLGKNKVATIWWIESSRSEFHMVYSVSKDDHFKKGFAAAVYHSIVSQAIREVRAEFSGSFLVVVVCAGCHAKVDARSKCSLLKATIPVDKSALPIYQ